MEDDAVKEDVYADVPTLTLTLELTLPLTACIVYVPLFVNTTEALFPDDVMVALLEGLSLHVTEDTLEELAVVSEAVNTTDSPNEIELLFEALTDKELELELAVVASSLLHEVNATIKVAAINVNKLVVFILV